MRLKPKANCTNWGKHADYKWNNKWNNRCLGKGSTCSYKPNHWMTVYHKCVVNNNLNQVVSNTEDDKWTTCVTILSQEIQFTIDKGAKCNTLILDNYQHWCTLVNWDPPKIPMLHSNHLTEPGWCSRSDSPAQELKHCCWIWNCQPGWREYAQWGGKTTEVLGLIARVDILPKMTVKQSTNNVPKDRVSQIQCQNTKVWCISCGTNNNVICVCHIGHTRKDCEQTPWNGKYRYISKVKQPIEWLQLHVEIWICINPSDLNKVVKIEHYHMPIVGWVGPPSEQPEIFVV